ncbi:hypothetical protein L1049_005186 [Liquidambar formosana]|uniref:Uncharacterized protein n=1 Tax=Liquidambar formosana TaxID=63359 RepID=A0AAP0RTW5_LIQFO
MASSSSSDRELEEQLFQFGNRLLNPPSSMDELLSLLDRLEINLFKVGQAPSRTMQDALLPSMKALISDELLRHEDTDVRVSVASCINEITRITAPDAPYEDEQMKEIFQLTVEAFGKLSHVSSHCYSKAVSILDTVAKVRSSLLMLDLECDTLVVEMFQHFLRAIRSNHPHAIFSDMEAIMCLVLEESEDISWELLCTLLESVKKENQNISPLSWKLGEKVIENCAAKLQPYLMEAVRSMGIALNDYAQIVASICQNESDTLEQHHVPGSVKQLAAENKLLDRTDSDEQYQVAEGLAPDAVCPGEVGSVLDGFNSMLGNDTSQTRNDDTFVDDIPLKKLERCRRTKQSKSTDARGNNEPDNLDSMKAVKSETGPETVRKKRGRRPNSLMNPEEGYDHSWISGRRKAPKVPCLRNSHDKVIGSSPSENPVSKAALPSAHGKEIEPQVFSDKIAQSETIAASSQSPNRCLPDGSHSKRVRRKKNRSMMNQDADQNSLPVPKGDLFSAQVEDVTPKPADAILRKENEGASDIQTEPQRHSNKNAIVAKTYGETTPASGDVVSMKEGPGDFEEKRLHPSVMNLSARDINEEGSSVQLTVGKKRRGRGRTTAEKNVTEESGYKKIVSGSTSKSSNENKNHLDKTPKTQSRRKCTPGREEASGMPHGVEDLNEQLVGKRVKVWWPKDKTFYEGVVDSFDAIKKKHKILYADGDEETLNLRTQRWELMLDDLLPDEGKQADLPSHDASCDMRGKKKEELKSVPSSKKKAVPSSKKVHSSSKRSGASAGKTVDGSTLDNSKDESLETDDKMKDGQISTEKLRSESLEAGKESKWNTPETDGTGKLSELADSGASLATSGKKRQRGMRI